MSEPNITDVDDAFGHWLAGFLDGEGCFMISHQSQRVGGAPICYMQLVLRADDAAILGEIQRRTGIGVFKARRLDSYSGTRSQGNTRPQAMWRVSSRTDCLALVRLLDRYPMRAKKAGDYRFWREAVQESHRVYVTYPLARRDYSRVWKLRDQMRAGRAWAEAPVIAEMPAAAGAQEGLFT